MAAFEETLASAGRRLGEVLRRAGVDASFGPGPVAELRDVARELAFSAELRDLYATAGPVHRVHIPAPLGGITLTPGRELAAYQSGYRTNGNDGRRQAGWPDSWVVVADHSADPFIADTGTPGTPVGIAMHGSGSWRPYWVARTPTDFLGLLACFTQAYVVEYLNGPDDDAGASADADADEIRPPAYHDRLAALLHASEPGVDVAAFLDYLSQ
ncbi:hypothetical protein [Embleya sp. AB8]|uniref:hypothetical protein n=1 Tax=Embleya sp. AB8 TaxID=3156304 RepID=UPI003C743425